MMADKAVRLADIQFFTSDNPRNEDPNAILADMQNGIVDKSNLRVVVDRAEAIESAIGLAGEGDLVAVLGKGHEDYQILGDRRIHFSDAEICQNALRKEVSR
jgi:UDP-N-acetylmuramoyl-L-alanyl-D-glutamate--2,6-diaminopimelate ligase